MSYYQMPTGNKVIFTYKLHIHISICANKSYLSYSFSFVPSMCYFLLDIFAQYFLL